MRVTFLGHSGFFLELPEADLLFDYYKGNLPAPDPGKHLFVFVSHVHADHFSKRIFSMAEKTEQIRYVLSDDIPKDKVPGELRAAGLVCFIGPEEDLTLPLVRTGSEKNAAGGQVKAEGPSLRVRTFPSTDEGVAFLVDMPSAARIYHAGDLNDWHWDDVDREWNDDQYRRYQDALAKIASCVAEDGHVPDAAFVPVDTRLGDGEFYWMGLDEYMKAVGARNIFPMHLFGDPSVIDRMRGLPCAEEYRDRIFGSGTPGEQFRIGENEV